MISEEIEEIKLNLIATKCKVANTVTVIVELECYGKESYLIHQKVWKIRILKYTFKKNVLVPISSLLIFKSQICNHSA